ncbi:hypothetical protein GCM10020331_092030 [Ectobacillus funiculus]
MSKKVYTTGILNNQGSPLANDTHIEVFFNLGDYSHSVTVEVFNWDTAENGIGPGPTPIPVFFTALLSFKEIQFVFSQIDGFYSMPLLSVLRTMKFESLFMEIT